jgi:hypothetical protein
MARDLPEVWKAQRRLAYEEGIREGRKEGVVHTVMLLIGQRFASVPDWVRERVIAADFETQVGWACRLFDAKTLDEVFSDCSTP